jgi:hypothetical protein
MLAAGIASNKICKHHKNDALQKPSFPVSSFALNPILSLPNTALQQLTLPLDTSFIPASPKKSQSSIKSCKNS